MNTIPEEQLEALRAMQSPLLAKDATLRDMFAGMALQGILANNRTLETLSVGDVKLGVEVAAMSYEAADYMLAARKEAK